MILYHLEKKKYRNVWPPEGTLFTDGRWNRSGQWVIYTSETIALAKLEILANENNLPVKRVCMTIKIESIGGTYKFQKSELPGNWMDKPYPLELVKFTTQFLGSGNLLMRIPSAQSYREFNYLISVRHADFHSKVKLLDISEEHFDSRLTK